MSSNTAKDFVVPKHSVYSGSKGAIESFIPVMALDCGKKKITVNGVAPGGTVTDMFHDVAKHYIPNSENMSIDDLKAVSVPPKSIKGINADDRNADGRTCVAPSPLRLSYRCCKRCLLSGKQGGRVDQRQGSGYRWWCRLMSIFKLKLALKHKILPPLHASVAQ